MKLAVCAVIYNDEGKVLGISRRNRPDDMGLPGGKVDPGETPGQAVVREVFEETGVHVFSLREVFKRVCEGEDTYDAVCYEALYKGEPRAMEEGFVVKWLTWAELLDEKNTFASYNRKLYEHMIQTGCSVTGAQ